MVYIFNKYIAPEKTIKIALTAILGIGLKNSQKITDELCINPNYRFWKLNTNQVNRLERFISKNFLVNVALNNMVTENIKASIQMKTYKGIRHSKGLPVNGQRTKTNSRTQRKLKGRIGKMKFQNLK